jgi:hypothetical protein
MNFLLVYEFFYPAMPFLLGNELFTQGLIFRTFFQGKILGKFPRKNGIFHGKSFEKSFFQEIPRNFPRKKCTKNWPQVDSLL